MTVRHQRSGNRRLGAPTALGFASAWRRLLVLGMTRLIILDIMNDSEHGDWQDTTIDSQQAQEHPEVAQAVRKIKALRQSIDNVDTAIVSLLAERFKFTSEVGVLKARWHRKPGLILKSRKCIGNSWSQKPRNVISASPAPEGIPACWMYSHEREVRHGRRIRT